MTKFEILEQIVTSGGIIGNTAKLCRDNEDIIDQFILECYDQKNTILAKELWSDELIREITEYIKLKQSI